jgi:hypothetical protein
MTQLLFVSSEDEYAWTKDGTATLVFCKGQVERHVSCSPSHLTSPSPLFKTITIIGQSDADGMPKLTLADNQ